MSKTKIKQVQNLALLIVRCIDSSSKPQHTELDVLEMMTITQLVINERLTYKRYDLHKHDESNGYIALYTSIKHQVLDTLHTSFSSKGKRGNGLIIQKFNTIFIDAVFDLMHQVGPTKSVMVLNSVFDTIRTEIDNLGITDAKDSLQASTILRTYASHTTYTQNTPLITQRMELIAHYAELYS